VVPRGGIRTGHRVHARVGLHLLRDPVADRPREAAVETADDEPFATEQLGEEVEVLDPQVRQVDVLLAESGQSGKGPHRLGALFRGEPVPLERTHG